MSSGPRLCLTRISSAKGKAMVRRPSWWPWMPSGRAGLEVTPGGAPKRALDVVAWARQVEEAGAGDPAHQHGCRRHREEYDNELNKAVTSAVGIPVIASGEREAGTPRRLPGGVDAVLAASCSTMGVYYRPGRYRPGRHPRSDGK